MIDLGNCYGRALNKKRSLWPGFLSFHFGLKSPTEIEALWAPIDKSRPADELYADFKSAVQTGMAYDQIEVIPGDNLPDDWIGHHIIIALTQPPPKDGDLPDFNFLFSKAGETDWNRTVMHFNPISIYNTSFSFDPQSVVANGLGKFPDFLCFGRVPPEVISRAI